MHTISWCFCWIVFSFQISLLFFNGLLCFCCCCHNLIIVVVIIFRLSNISFIVPSFITSCIILVICCSVLQVCWLGGKFFELSLLCLFWLLLFSLLLALFWGFTDFLKSTDWLGEFELPSLLVNVLFYNVWIYISIHRWIGVLDNLHRWLFLIFLQ